MNLCCPNCPTGSTAVVKNGHFFRRSDSRKIQCFRCNACRRYFSSATFSDCYRQKKRRINDLLRDALAKRMALRYAARYFKVSRTTIARRLIFLGEQARRRNALQLLDYQQVYGPITRLQFDDMLSAEHTKCKPITSTVAVQEKTRIIIDYTVAQIPAFGLLATISRKKYGKRADHNRRERHRLVKRLSAFYPGIEFFRTDKHKHYPVVIKNYFPNAEHKLHNGERATGYGQGELNNKAWDHLFSVNHTLGMFRDKMSRLSRRSWNITKNIKCLDHHMAIYIESHNRSFIEKMDEKRERYLAT